MDLTDPPSPPEPPRREPTPLWLSLTVIGIIVLAALLTWSMGPFSESPPAQAPMAQAPMALGAVTGEPAAKVPAPQPEGPAPNIPDSTWAPPRPAPNSLEARAFALVYPEEPIPVTVEGQEGTVKFRPLLLHRLNDNTLVLLSVGRDVDPLHQCEVCGGVYSIAYFTRAPRLRLQGAPFVRWGRTVGWGQPPELTLLKAIGPAPMVLVRNLQMADGQNQTLGELVQLGPTISDVSIVADDLFLDYDDRGAEGHCLIKGRVRRGVPGRSFIMRYTGNFSGDIVYRRSGKTYRRPPNTPFPTTKCPPNMYSDIP